MYTHALDRVCKYPGKKRTSAARGIAAYAELYRYMYDRQRKTRRLIYAYSLRYIYMYIPRDRKRDKGRHACAFFSFRRELESGTVQVQAQAPASHFPVGSWQRLANTFPMRLPRDKITYRKQQTYKLHAPFYPFI